MEKVGREEDQKILLSEDILDKVTTFKSLKTAGKEDLFFELCFCILAANTSAELGIRMQNTLGKEPFIHFDQVDLRNALKLARYRFYNTRSAYIFNSRWIIDEMPGLINRMNPWDAREYLVNGVYGIGYKEASHFLRNVGIFDFAILDKHILQSLGNSFGLDVPKTMTKKKYLEIEKKFIDISRTHGLDPGVLDLILWKKETGRVLK